MATVTKTYTGTETNTGMSGEYPSTWTFVISWDNAITASGSTFVLPTFSATAKYVQSRKNNADARVGGGFCNASGTFISGTYVERSSSGSWASNTTRTLSVTTGSSSVTLNTSNYFTSSNKTERSVGLQFRLVTVYGWSEGNNVPSNLYYPVNISGVANGVLTFTGTVTLDAPPTVTVGTPTYSTPHYAGLGSYSVPITQAKAQYGGNISSITLTVGSDSVTQNYSSATVSNQTLTLTPSIAGTYTPTITVTDTRGQVTTTNLSQITVNAYTAPSINFDLTRCSSSGAPQAEGEYGLVTANISYVDAIAELTQPTVSVKDESDNTIISSTTWYTTWNATNGVSNAVNWTNYNPTSPVTLYGVVSATGSSFSPNESYTVSITPTDNMGGVASTITQTLATGFFTIDFQAGGKEIAFGAPANDDLTDINGTDYSDEGLFKCKMGTNFNDMTSQEVEDFVDGLNISETSYFNVESIGYQLANTVQMTYLGGKLYGVKLPDGKYVVFFSAGVSVNVARTNLSVIRFTTADGYVLHFISPYYFMAEVSGANRFCYGNNDGEWLNATGTWSANTNYRISGVALMSKTNTHI